MFRRLISRQPNLVLALVALTLAIRVLVPSGFMPTTGTDGMVRISLCTGMGPQTAWLDKSLHIHKDAPVKSHHDPQPCGFGVLALGTDVPNEPAVEPLIPLNVSAALLPNFAVAIGLGLAAPPPPSTGPPILI